MSTTTPSPSSSDSQPEVLTSRVAAQICGVSFRTVIRWIERGELKAYRLPGRGDYRIVLNDLQLFMRKHGMPDEEHEGARRILVVDDDPAMARAIERVLKRAGYQTCIAADGFQAGALLHTFKPVLMTLDLRMAGQDGFGVLQFLRDTGQLERLKVLVISGETQARLRAALEKGAHEAITKPFKNEQMLEAVRRLLDPARGRGGTVG